MIKPTILLTILLISSKLIYGQLYLGGSAAYCRSTFMGDTPPNEIYGWSGGLMLQMNSTYMFAENTGITFNVNVHNSSAELQKFDDTDPEIKTDSAQLTLASFAFPLGVIVKNKSGRFFVKSALELQIPFYAKSISSDGEEDLIGKVNDVNLALKFGCGFYIPIGNPRLVLGFDYMQGLNNLFNDNFDFDKYPEKARTKIKSMQFTMGVEWPIDTKGKK